MTFLDNRKYPRWEIHSPQKVLSLNDSREANKNFVFSQNISATGYCFRSLAPIKVGESFLVHLQNHEIEDLKLNKAQVMKAGRYLMAQVVRCDPRTVDCDVKYEVGCEFVKINASPQALDLFTYLINCDALQNISSSN